MRQQYATSDAMTLYSRVASGCNVRSLDEINAVDDYEKELRLLVMSLKGAMESGDLLPDMIDGMGDIPVPEDNIRYLESRQNMLQAIWRNMENNRATWLERCREHDELPELIDEAMSVCRQAFDQMEKLRWHAMEHNVDCEPKGEGKLLSSPEEIDAWFASL
ncbi:hypothetical protein N8J30_004257 [Salmonella enterica subsp. enterica serovar Newport]|nr:hypothetical protein [Salmonella enterica subsp. enterica serovar Newport]EJW0497125.1 hypothetical protein [Salmonella enterica subsp. enterica serovar Newport]ELA5318839.1 hypothetical protein [Salmonella enterica subsp. enterica serovar Newport]